MARVEVAGDRLIVHIEGLDKVLALKSRLEVPLEHVLSADADPDLARRIPRWLRLPGTYIPGLITAGSYYTPGDTELDGWSFWDVHDLATALVLHLAHEHYRWLVVGVADPDATVAQIRAAIRRPA
ncbi:MAG TPA: hypothetical protein VFA70_07215 [Dehalococcoidia bacterium]|jgi:hypothetical protein|nr:hypothetical protein [Dehalococcoidia bacterium]